MTVPTRAELKWQLSEAQREIDKLREDLDRERRKTERVIVRRIAKKTNPDLWRDML